MAIVVWLTIWEVYLRAPIEVSDQFVHIRQNSIEAEKSCRFPPDET